MSNVPKAGDSAPGFELLDSSGNPQTLEGLLDDSARMLVFFRGMW
jgi:peroxiredoxin